MNNYKDIKNLQPVSVREIKDFDVIAAGQVKVFERLVEKVNKLFDNSFFNSLDLEGVRRWERIFTIQPLGTIEMRRNAIIAYRRGRNKLSGTIIKNMSLSYENGEVEVWFDKEKQTLMIKFTSLQGIPKGFEKLQEILEELKPCRMPIEYLFSYLLIKDIHNVMTLDTLESTTLDKFAF